MARPRPVPARSRPARRLAAVLLGMYLLVVAAAVWLPLPLNPPPMTNAPTYELHLARPDLTAWDFRRNVVMTVPFGVLLPLVVRWRYEAMVLACVALTLVAETGQYVGSVAVGWDWRAFDVNDLLANSVGGWLGLALTGLVLGVGDRARRRRAVSETRRPPRWIVGAAVAGVVSWVVVAGVPTASRPAAGVDECGRGPQAAATRLDADAWAWADGGGGVCLSVAGSTASVPATAPDGEMFAHERAGGLVHVGVLRAGHPTRVELPDGTSATVEPVRVPGSRLRVWSLRTAQPR